MPKPKAARAAAPKDRPLPRDTVEAMARGVVARRVSYGRVRLPLTIPRRLAEQLTAQAIRKGKNLEALAAEIPTKAGT